MAKRKKKADAGAAKKRTDGGDLALSYLGLRKGIGVIGAALPIVLAIGKVVRGDPGMQGSISAYYYTEMRDVFVGSLVVIGVFMMSCRGYDRWDHRAGIFAGVCSIGVALFPTTVAARPGGHLVGGLHLAFASLFFGMLAYISLFLFTKTNPRKAPTPRKRQRNVVYQVCGYTIIACLVLAVVLARVPADAIGVGLLFWLESVAVVAFGVSWLTKGEALLKDR